MVENKRDTERKQFSLGFCLGLVALGIVIDQFLKYWIFHSLSSGYMVAAGFGIRPFQNYNFAFSVPLPIALMYIFYVAAIIVVFWYLLSKYKQMGRVTIFAWLLIASGALSNVGERALTGYVKDYLFIFNGIFNLADLYILAAVLVLLITDRRRFRKRL